MYALHVLNVETQELTFTGFNFPEKRLAAQHAREKGIKAFKILDAVEDDTWKDREKARFDSGQYEPVFFSEFTWYQQSEYAALHFVHVSENQPGKLAYTSTPDKGREDRQTVMNPGRYLREYFSDVLADHEIEELANRFVREHGAGFELRLAKSGEEIADSYRAAHLGSCMHFGSNGYNSSVHPCTVYGAGDIECATAWNDGECVARCLIWRKDDGETLVGRIYGHIEAMQSALKTIGVDTENTDSHYDELDGARLQKIMNGSEYVIPYIDSSQHAKDCGNYLVIDSYGEIDSHVSHDTGGLSGHHFICDRCEDGIDEHESYPVITQWGTEQYCENCNCYHTFYCENTEEYYSDSDFTSIHVMTRHGFETWCEERTEGDSFYCEYTHEYYDHNYYSGVTVHDSNGLETGYACVEKCDDITLCDNSGEYYEQCATVELENGEIWGADIFESEGFTCKSNGLNYSKNDDEYICDVNGDYWLFENAESDLFFEAENWHEMPDHPNSTLKAYAVQVSVTRGLRTIIQHAETPSEAAQGVRAYFQTALTHNRVNVLMGIRSIYLVD